LYAENQNTGGMVYLHTKSLIKHLLRNDNIVIEEAYFEEVNEEEHLIIYARPFSRETWRCPRCGKRCKGYSNLTFYKLYDIVYSRNKTGGLLYGNAFTNQDKGSYSFA
jgi:hypothetical protein